MTRQNVTKGLAIVATVTGAIVMLGWILDIEVLKSISPTWVTMKFSTALCFVLSGITLFFIASAVAGKREIALLLIPISAGGVLLLMLSLLLSTFLGVRSGIEDLFVTEQAGAVMTTTPGRPSVGTMTDFILVAVAGILTMIDAARFTRVQQVFGWIVAVIGSLALLGYVMNMPVLYYSWEGFSTAMAIHTAILFVMLGVGLIVLSKAKAPDSDEPKHSGEDYSK